jgi:hypothetical protein
MQRRGKPISVTIEELLGNGVFCWVRPEAILRSLFETAVPSVWRRRNGKSQIWHSKIWSRVPRISDPRKTILSRASSVFKRQTRPLIREGTPEKQDRNCQRVINIWSWTPDGARHQDLLIDWPSVAMWLDFDFDGSRRWMRRDCNEFSWHLKVSFWFEDWHNYCVINPLPDTTHEDWEH